MSIVQFDRAVRSLDSREPGERPNCPWVGVVGLIAWGERPSTTPTHGHFVLSPVSLALRDPHLHLRSHGKIGDCEQSTSSVRRQTEYLKITMLGSKLFLPSPPPPPPYFCSRPIFRAGKTPRTRFFALCSTETLATQATGTAQQFLTPGFIYLV